MLHPIVATKLEEVAGLCRRNHVRRLDLFGSATSERFDPATSDLDFIVEFEPEPPGGYFHTYFDLKEALEALFRRPVDLVMAGTVVNPYVAASIEASQQKVYAA